MMKFVFIVDTSPLMLLKHKDSSQAANSSGMTFFQESIFAIEEFINHRKRLNEFKTDKYYLFKTLPKQLIKESKGGVSLVQQILLSSCEHPFKHFQHQLFNMQNTRELTDFDKSIMEVMKLVNSNRFLYGAANRINGIQITRIEPCNVIVFTANPSFDKEDLVQRFMNVNQSFHLSQQANIRSIQPEKPSLFDELFQWDQSLHLFNFRESAASHLLQSLCHETGGTYKLITSFHELRTRIQLLSESSAYTVQCKIRMQGESVLKGRFQFDMSQKIKRSRQVQMSAGQHHRMNLEEDDNRIFSKDRWPIPLADTRFTQVNKNNGCLYFGASCPTFIIQEKPVNFDVSRCVTEILHLTDPELLCVLTDKLITNKLPPHANLSTLSWFVHAEGETQQYPFGLLKVSKNQQGECLSLEAAQRQKHDLECTQQPYQFTLHIMPLNFTEFWPLIETIDKHKEGQDQSSNHLKTKWRLSFQKYNEVLPGYYNDYLNSYLRHLNATELFLKQTKQVYLDNNVPLQSAISALLRAQDSQEKHHDKFFRASKQDHSVMKPVYEYCCANIRKYKTPLGSGKANKIVESVVKMSDKRIEIAPVQERDSLIGHTLFMFSQVQIAMEIFQPVVVGGFGATYPLPPQNGFTLSFSQQPFQTNAVNKLEDQARHNLLIIEMGDFERVLREGMRYFRLSQLSDQENVDYNRVFFGNPFKFLQIMHSKATQMQGGAISQAQDMNSAGAFDERMFEHNLVGGHETPKPQPSLPPTVRQVSQAIEQKKKGASQAKPTQSSASTSSVISKSSPKPSPVGKQPVEQTSQVKSKAKTQQKGKKYESFKADLELPYKALDEHRLKVSLAKSASTQKQDSKISDALVSLGKRPQPSESRITQILLLSQYLLLKQSRNRQRQWYCGVRHYYCPSKVKYFHQSGNLGRSAFIRDLYLNLLDNTSDTCNFNPAPIFTKGYILVRFVPRVSLKYAKQSYQNTKIRIKLHCKQTPRFSVNLLDLKNCANQIFPIDGISNDAKNLNYHATE